MQIIANIRSNYDLLRNLWTTMNISTFSNNKLLLLFIFLIENLFKLLVKLNQMMKLKPITSFLVMTTFPWKIIILLLHYLIQINLKIYFNK